jgi:hypothetical protein
MMRNEHHVFFTDGSVVIVRGTRAEEVAKLACEAAPALNECVMLRAASNSLMDAFEGKSDITLGDYMGICTLLGREHKKGDNNA